MPIQPKKRLRFSLSTNIVLGLCLGVAAGLFLGEYCASLKVIGDAFIKLLQMSILPYIVVSIISGIGSLTHDLAKSLARKAGGLMLLFWAVGFGIILILPLTFPSIESGSFFSTSLVAPQPEVDFVDLYIPANPFKSMADSVIPAVVLFSIFVGVALIGVKDNQELTQPLSILSKTFMKISKYIVQLTPIGVFAITASAAGTMTMAQFGKLQVYFVAFLLGVLLLTFLVLPLMVSALTPFKYKDIFALSKDALITGLTTGNLFIIIPLVIQNCENMFDHYKIEHPEIKPSIDIVVPAIFNFPSLGKLLVLLFILFAGWYYGNPVTLASYPNFIFSGLFSFFGSTDIAIPFMLDLMQIPADAFQLYLVTHIINKNLAILVSAMNLVAFTLIATCALTGLMAANWRKVAVYATVSVLLTLGITLGGRVFLTFSIQHIAPTEDMALSNMKLKTRPQPAAVRKTAPRVPAEPAVEPGLSRLEIIKRRGSIRIGYHKDNLPFSFFNRHGELVGFDIDLAHALATDLGLQIEFIPFDFETLDQQVKDDQFDIAMSGIFILPSYLNQVVFSKSYMRTNWAFVVKDHRRHRFESLEEIKSIDGLTIGVAGEKNAKFEVERTFPLAKAVQLDSVNEFFQADWENIDCLLVSAEAGSPWTLLYPQYQVVVPKPAIGTQSLGYPITGGDQALLNYINSWMDLDITKKYRDELYRHWILGEGAQEKRPRWSVIRDVLHWVK